LHKKVRILGADTLEPSASVDNNCSSRQFVQALDVLQPKFIEVNGLRPDPGAAAR